MSRFPKLTETFILFEMSAVERQGVDIWLFPLLHEREATMHPEAAPYVARATYLPFLSLPILASQWAFLRRSPRRYLGAIRTMIAGTWRSPNFLIGGLGIFPKVVHAAGLMERDGVRHVHCHFATHPALAGLLIHRLTGITYSFTAHGSDLHVDRTMLCQKVAEAAFAVTISNDNRAVFERECGAPVADPGGHPLRGRHRHASTRCHASADPSRPLAILSIGTLHEVKGQTHLIEACRRLALDDVAFTCRFVGDGPDRAALERQIADAGLADRVELLGQRKRDEVIALLEASDVLVAPSVPTRGGKREGIPVVLMEAMSAGVPGRRERPVGHSGARRRRRDRADGRRRATRPRSPRPAPAGRGPGSARPGSARPLAERVVAEFDVDRSAARLDRPLRGDGRRGARPVADGRRSGHEVAADDPARPSGSPWPSIAYTYVGFPLLVLVRARLRPRPPGRPRSSRRSASSSPRTTRRRRSAPRLDNLVGARLPGRAGSSVVVASDGSDDATVEIAPGVRRPAASASSTSGGSARPTPSTAAVAAAHGEILVFTDANTMFEPRRGPGARRPIRGSRGRWGRRRPALSPGAGDRSRRGRRGRAELLGLRPAS